MPKKKEKPMKYNIRMIRGIEGEERVLRIKRLNEIFDRLARKKKREETDGRQEEETAGSES